MKVQEIFPFSKDDKGTIADILLPRAVDQVTVVFTKKDQVRGNHFHQNMIQWLYLYSGKMKAMVHRPDSKSAVSHVLKPGSLLEIDKTEKHSLVALEDSVLFVFSAGLGLRDKEEDTIPLRSPLVKEA